MLHALLGSRYAFEAYFEILPPNTSKSIQVHQSFVLDRTWWAQINSILLLLDLIDQALIQAKSDRASIIDVIPRWKRIQAHLASDHVDDTVFEKRFKR
jgi:hypothetical protein